MREKHQSVAASTPPTRDQAPNPVMCPDWESDGRPFGLWDDTQHTEPHQLGPSLFFKEEMFLKNKTENMVPYKQNFANFDLKFTSLSKKQAKREFSKERIVYSLFREKKVNSIYEGRAPPQKKAQNYLLEGGTFVVQASPAR